MRFISRHIFTGFITVLPVTLTLYLIYWMANTAESFLGGVIAVFLPSHQILPGMGLLAGLLVVFIVGLLMHAYVFRSIFAKGEQILYHMPLIKSVYRAFRDFFDYFSPKSKKEFEQVVSVEIGNSGMQVIGFVTQVNPENLPNGFKKDNNVLVYIPLSYMIGGYTILVPHSQITPLDINMEEAMRFVLTAGVTSTFPVSHKKSQ